MSGVATAVVGAAVVGGYMSSQAQKSAAKSAANAQNDASAASIAESQRQFDSIKELLAPYTMAGSGAEASAGTFDEDAYLAQNPDVAANWAGTPLQHYMMYGQAEGRAKPMKGAHGAITGSLQQQQALLGLLGTDAQKASIDAIANGPQMQAMQQQGENAMLQNASATGGLRGGNLQGALAQFRPQLLSQLIQQQYQNLGGLTSIGQNAAAGVGNAGMQSSAQIQNSLQQTGAANAGAALATGAANANMYSGIAGTASTLGTMKLLGKF